jgi:hypothetical protein
LCDGIPAVVSFANDLDAHLVREHAIESVADDLMVVYNQDSNGHGFTVLGAACGTIRTEYRIHTDAAAQAV